MNNAATFLVIDPDCFGAETRHRERVTALLGYLDDTSFSEELLPESARGEELLVPGEAEHRTMADREERGIPIDDRTLELLSELAAAYDVPVPSALDPDRL